MKNKKAFSLTELLAVIVIVGILAVLAVVGVSRYIEKSRSERDSQNKNNTEMATKLYMQNNKDKLPVLIGDSIKVDLNTLRKAGYLKEDVSNSKGEDCMEKSFVRVYKLSKTEYSYYTYLYCGKEVVPAEVEVPKPEIVDFKFTGGNYNGTSFDDVKDAKFSFKINGSEIDDSVGIYSYNYSIYADIEKKGEFAEVFKSDNLMGGFEKSLIVTSKALSNYLSVTGFSSIKVAITAVNEQGGITNYTSIIGDYSDQKAPSCTDIKGNARDDDDWINKVNYAGRDVIGNDRSGVARITVGCDDGAGSGCKRDFFTRTWPNDDVSPSGLIQYKYGSRWAYVAIEDNAKDTNVTKCYVRTNVDLQAPKVVVTIYSKNGNTKKEVSSLVVQDQATINARVPEGTIYAGDYQNLVGTGSEKWMNSSNYKDGIVIDVKVSDNLYLYSYEWDVNDAGVAGGTSNVDIRSTASLANGVAEQDNGVLAKGTFESSLVDDPTNDEELALAEHGLMNGEIKGLRLVREGKRYGKLSVCDKAGNCTVVNIFANIDRTAPKVPTVTFTKKTSSTNYVAGTINDFTDHNHWSNEKIRASVEGQRVDSGDAELSGWDHFDYLYFKQTGKSGNDIIWNNPSKVRVSPSGSNHQYGFDVTDQGTHIVQFDSCDKAGNCSNMSSEAYVKVDTVKPTCTIKKTYTGTTGPNAAGWLKKGESVTLSHNCKDDDKNFSSGCDSTNTENNEKYLYNYNIKTKQGGALGVNKGGYVYDYAGNKSDECPKNAEINIDIDPPTCTTKITNNTDTGPNYNGDWTTNPVVITGMCSDTGGSECKTSPTTVYKNDIDQMIHYTEYVVDKADNKTACNGYHQVKIDKTAPTGTCTIEGSYSSDNNNSYRIKVTSKEDPKTNNAASGVQIVKYWRSGDNTYGSNDTLNLSCGSSGKKEGWIQVIDNVGNASPQIKCEGYVNVPECCTEVTYRDGSTCNKKCDSGTFNQVAYSALDGRRCNAKDLSSGGSACNTQQCCGANAVFSSQTSCSKICGGGKITYYYVSKFDSNISCGSSQIDCNTQICAPPGKPCNIRGSTKKKVATWRNCTAGDSPHNYAYIHYCWDGSQYVTRKQNPQLNKYDYICPNHPYGTGSGWVIIPD